MLSDSVFFTIKLTVTKAIYDPDYTYISPTNLFFP